MRIADLVINPIFHWVFLVFWITWFSWKKRPVWPISILLLAYLWVVLLSPLPLNWIAELEGEYPVPEKSELLSDTAVVLTGEMFAYDELLGQYRFRSGGSRILETIRLAKRISLKKIIISGTSPETLPNSLVPEAEAMARFAQELGIEFQMIEREMASKSTYENAVNSLARLEKSQPFLLVTSAYHMKRAMETFKKLGGKPIAYPVDFQVIGARPPDIWSWGWHNLRLWNLYFHERVGSWYYSYKGYL